MRKLFLYCIYLFNSISYRYKSLTSYYQKNNFAKCGNNVSIDYDCYFTNSNIYCGNNVVIGRNALFMATLSNIYIGNYVMFAPNVTIIGGDHRTDIKGRFMFNIKNNEKIPENDKDVIIGDDV
jgi:acetyltransferase-like isoleucine patch superfamily enzyme